jgi:outer membrane receptor protein involved in Fe transport
VLGYQRHELESNGTDAVIESYGNFVTTLADADPDVTLISGDPFDRVTQDSSVIQLDTETEISSLHINGEINDEWSFASVTAYQEFSQGNARSRRAENSGDTIISPLVFNHFNTQSDRDSFSQELRFNYDGDDWISTFGAFYADTSAETITPLTITSFLLLGEPQRIALLSQFDQNTEEWAIFSNSTYNINDRWDVTFGLRYAEVDKSDYSATQIGVGKYADLQSIFVPIVSRWDVPEQATKWDAITGGLKFTYDINDEVTLYFGYDRGFKAGGHDTANHDLSDPTGNSSIISPAFDEEYGDNYEIGLKGIFLDRTLSWNGSMFYQIYSDYQVNIPDPITTFKTVNAAEVVVQGIEMDFQWLLGEHFTLDGNMAYTDSRYDSYEDAGCNTPQYTASQCTVQPDGTATQDLSGKRLNLVSPWTANLNASWNDQFSNGLQWFARAEWAFRDDRIASPDLNPETTMGAYSLFNASFGLLAEDERWSATLWGKNLLDEEYLVSYEGNTDGDVIEGFRVIVGDERTYGITLSYRFD